MAYTKISVQTLDRAPSDADVAATQPTIDAYIAQAKLDGTTDGIVTPVANPLGFSRSRVWLDQTAAQNWSDFIIPLAASYGYTMSVTINDNI